MQLSIRSCTCRGLEGLVFTAFFTLCDDFRRIALKVLICEGNENLSDERVPKSAHL